MRFDILYTITMHDYLSSTTLKFSSQAIQNLAIFRAATKKHHTVKMRSQLCDIKNFLKRCQTLAEILYN